MNSTSQPLPPNPCADSLQSHIALFFIPAICTFGFFIILLITWTVIWGRHCLNGNSVEGGDVLPIQHIRTVGLQQSVIDSITAFKFKKFDNLLAEGSDCSVCLTECEESDYLRILPKCSHVFHLICIDTWLQSHNNCPVCRALVVDEGFTGSTLASRSERLSYTQEDQLAALEIQGESSSSDRNSARQF